VPPAEEMLQKHEANGVTIDPGYGVDVVWVGPQGIAILFLAEFCATSEEPTKEPHQDWERKAFRRLAKPMKALVPSCGCPSSPTADIQMRR